MLSFEVKEKIFSFWVLQVIGWLSYWLLVCLTLLSLLPADASISELFRSKLMRAFLGFLLTGVMRLIYKRFVSPQSVGAAAAVSIIASIIFGIIWEYSMSIFYWSITPDREFSVYYAALPQNALNYSIILLGWSVLYFGIKFWREWQIERENALQSATLAQQAQLEMLRYQINPHFLFNALNSIRAMVNEDQNRARRMITQLAEFLRHSLIGSDKKEIPLREELDAARNYLAIEKIRFEENLEIEYDVDAKSEDFLVPCFLLNPLVENSIKHGSRSGSKPLKIKISAVIQGETLILQVVNTGALADLNGSSGTQIGLKNVRERLQHFGDNSSFELRQEDEFVAAKIKITRPGPLL
ncbi:MAG TPA: histidine kinase [Pyrinomonadaceae bacterium]|nr:histidine kinase [Pyrinomonadaceae bacterium]